MMFCSRCGKKVLESMLFCPFCGSEIVIPDQSAPEEDNLRADAAGANVVEQEPVKLERFTFDIPDDDGASDAADEPALEPFSRASDRFTHDWGEPDDAAEEAADAPGAEKEEAADATPFAPDPEAKQEEAPERRSRETGVPEMRGRGDRQGAGARRAPSAERRHTTLNERSERQRRLADTFVPRKDAGDDEDMFMDDVADNYDDFDAFEERLGRRASHLPSEHREEGRRSFHRYEDDDFDDDDDDDEEDSSFFMRHIRGLVGIILFLVLILLVVLYGLSNSGQRTLARINATLPLRADVYSRLGYESYQAEDYQQAGVYYERALAREKGSYNFASSAAMSYIAAGRTDKAVEMLKRCIEINPLAVEPYVYLVNLYPDASARPGDVVQLIQLGYQKTGDERLKQG